MSVLIGVILIYVTPLWIIVNSKYGDISEVVLWIIVQHMKIQYMNGVRNGKLNLLLINVKFRIL